MRSYAKFAAQWPWTTMNRYKADCYVAKAEARKTGIIQAYYSKSAVHMHSYYFP